MRRVGRFVLNSLTRKLARKSLFTIGLTCLSSLLLPAPSFSWNQATHAYISDALAARAGHDNLQEMWGSVTPDFFNYVFAPGLCPGWISDQTHGTYEETFLRVWNAAGSEKEDALAYGFVSHNQPWGADFVAHISGLRPGYENDGYIIVKARQLLNTSADPATLHPTFGEVFAGDFGMSPDAALLIAHVLTEYAVDIRLGSEVDPQLGRRLATAARSETKSFADLLVEAFAADYAATCFGGDDATAASALTAAEKAHRKDMIYLGQAISRPAPVAVQLLAEQLVAILPDFLGRALPENVERILEAGILSSMVLCDDYRAEIDAAIEFVDESLKNHGIDYEFHGK